MTTITIDTQLDLAQSHFATLEEAVQFLSAVIDPDRVMMTKSDHAAYHTAQQDYEKGHNIVGQDAIDTLMAQRGIIA